MQKLYLLLILVGFCILETSAQRGITVTSKAINSGGIQKTYSASKHEPPRAIEFTERAVTSKTFLTNINAYFNIPEQFVFTEVETNVDQLGMRHYLMQQYYQGLPVEGMGYRVHEKNGYITAANGRAIREINLTTTSAITEAQAFSKAVSYLQTKDTTVRAGKKMIVSKDFTFARESFSIAFQFDIDVSLIERWRVSIDASNGDLINKVSLVSTCSSVNENPQSFGAATGKTRYYGTQNIKVEKFDNGASRLVGVTDHGGLIGTYSFNNASIFALIFDLGAPVSDIYSSTGDFTESYHRTGVSVQWAVEQAYEYYYKKYNRNSYDNLGSKITSYVHVDHGLDNAFWTGRLMAFGDGSNNNPLVELDVVGHELTHAVTQYEAKLQYAYESGALNESFSDIFGKAIEFEIFGDTATWMLTKHYREGGLRDMSNPNLKSQPDTYLGDLWYTGYEDNGGVHYNSGVQNFWFYLLCEGGSGVNDHGMNYSINAIGMDAATKIAYRNLSEYLNSESDYLDSRIGSLLAATDLYGKNSQIYQEVDKAWDAVGVIDEPIISSLELYDITATTVKIKGNFFPRGDTVSYHFEYGTTPAYGTSSSIYQYSGSVEGIVTGLASQTKYYLRLVATNENGNTYEPIEFTTISLAPMVKIKETVDVTETTAILYGQINPNSLATAFHFEYGTTPDLGMVTSSFFLPDTTEFLNVAADVDALQPRQLYYYRLIADNGFSSSETEVTSFFTAAKPVISSHTPGSGPIDTVVTIFGHNFNTNPEQNIVKFGATRSVVLSANSTELKVKVPAGASLGPITVMDSESGLIAASMTEFVPTFSAQFKKRDLQLTMGWRDYIYQTLIEDMDGDGRPDIVGRHYLGFSVFQNVNQGGDLTEQSFVRNIFNGEVTPGTLSLADFDGNGLSDIVTTYNSAIRIYPNFSVPGYIFFGTPIDFLPNHYTNRLTLDDFDLDGHIDIAGIFNARSDSTSIVIIRNQNSKGSINASGFEEKYSMTVPYRVFGLERADLNNDGKSDLLLSTHNTDLVVTLKNLSYPGTFLFEKNEDEYLASESFPLLKSQDLNQDGLNDIFVTAYSSDEPGTIDLLQNSSTSSAFDFTLSATALSGYSNSDVGLADITGDGQVDFVVGINDGKFIVVKNNVPKGELLSTPSFELLETYASEVSATSKHSSMSINDLNGDGRPDIVNTYSFNYLSYSGFTMEIWQNATPNCPDPSLISFGVIKNTVVIQLPANTTLDDFQIEYKYKYYSYWEPVASTTLVLNSNTPYEFRARAKCYLGFTEYLYSDVTTDCVDISSFSLTEISVGSVKLWASDNLSSYEIQYSVAGSNQWVAFNNNSNRISNLLPGTTYDLRFRGKCSIYSEFNYRQFTTICPALSSITITDIEYNRATVNWVNNYPGTAIIEYSDDNENWSSVDATQELTQLRPSHQYFVRGRLACLNSDSDFIQTSFTTPCAKVEELYVNNITPFTAVINWTDESAAEGFTIRYWSGSGGTTTTLETTENSIALISLRPGTHYTLEVAPHCISEKDFTPLTFTTQCYALYNLSANMITYTSAQLTWTDDFSESPYVVRYSIAGSNVWTMHEASSTTISLNELRPGTQYEARVHINCPSGVVPYASLFFETDLYGETTYAPNPTQGELTIYPSKNLIGSRYRFYDNAGRIVLMGEELRDYTFDLSALLPGIYALKIEGEKTLKIIKQ